MTPLLGKHYSLLFLPAAPSPPSRTLEGLFELTRRPSRALNLASCVASGTTEIQGHRQVCRARRGGPRTPPTTTDANIVRLLKTYIFTQILEFEKSTE